MRVLLVNDYATPTGGAELQTLDIRDGLRARGHDARVFASNVRVRDGNFADYSCVGTTSPFRTLLQTGNPSARSRLRQVVDDFGPDVVHVRMFLTQLSPLVLPVLRDVPALCHVTWYRAVCPVGTKELPDGSPCHVRAGRACRRNGCLPRRDWAPLMTQRALLRRWFGVFDGVVALSDAVARELAADGLGPATVLGNAVRALPERPPLSDPPTIGFAGRMVRSKGLDVLIRAFDRVARDVPDARLVIAGDGPDEAPIRRLAAASPASARIEIVGHVGRAELERVLAGAWVQAVPSTWQEPFGNVAAEALMRGTAVVASDRGGLAATVRDGESGFLVPPGDESTLATRLVRLLRDRDLAETMGRAGREHALAHLGMPEYIDRLTTIYSTLGARVA